jgi:hypothetical protein
VMHEAVGRKHRAFSLLCDSRGNWPSGQFFCYAIHEMIGRNLGALFCLVRHATAYSRVSIISNQQCVLLRIAGRRARTVQTPALPICSLRSRCLYLLSSS